MIAIVLSCSMCCKNKKLLPNSDQQHESDTLRKIVESAGWIAQQNGANFDIYCSEKCAE